MTDIVPPKSNETDIYSLGFDRDLNKANDVDATALVYDALGGAVNASQIAPGGDLSLRSLTIGGLVKQVAQGDDMQSAIDAVSRGGGGTVQLISATYSMTSNISMRNNVELAGAGNTILDFQNTTYGILATGSKPYNTGTASVTNDSQSIVGSGTTWTSSMVGQSILLADFWYKIVAVADTTHLTIDSPYAGTTNATFSYVIATTLDNVTISGITVQNSLAALIKAQFVNGIALNGVTGISGLIGFDGDDSAFILFSDCDFEFNATGATLNNCNLGTFFNSNINNSTTGGGLVCNTITNWGFEIFSFENNTGNTISLTNVTNCGFEDFTIRETTKGVELVSGNNNITFSDGSVSKASSDAIKLTATSDAIQISNINISNNTGFGINIAASTCDNNIIIGNYFSTNTAGNLTNSGTATIIRGNSGVSDNITETDLSLSDLTTNNVTSTKHGFAPKTPADATQFLNGAATAAWAQVKDSDLSTSDITTNNSSTSKHGFLLKLNNSATQFMNGQGAWATPSSASAVTLLPQPNFTQNGSHTATTLSSNTTLSVGQIIIPFGITVNKITLIAGGVTVAGTYKLALFSEDGQTQYFSVTTASITTNFQVVTTSVSAVALNAGVYYIAILPVSTANVNHAMFTADQVDSIQLLRDSVTSEPIVEGTVTVTASTMPSTITPGSITSALGRTLAVRLDN